MVRFLRIISQNIKKITNYNNYNTLGRWNLNDDSDIKATLANMDSCGDALCGNPNSYNDHITKILKEKEIKN